MVLFQQPFMSGGFPSMNRAVAGAVGGWVELGRISGTGASSTMTVSSLADKRYYMFLLYSPQNAEHSIRFNGDTGSNYSSRESQNGSADGTRTSDVQMYIDPAYSGTTAKFSTGYIANYSTKEKLLISHTAEQRTAGASNAPQRWEVVAKHAQTSNPISSISAYTPTSNWTSNDELVVLGYDPLDSHTNNFWEELASVDLSGGAADQISSGTITAKKYLWVQGYFEDSGGAINQEITFNNDTSNNYAVRHNVDGGTDSTSTSRANGYIGVGGITSPNFLNFFIINNASKEKLVIGHDVTQNTAGASTAPRRAEGVFKWVNTSNQITEIDFNNSAAGSYGTKTIIKVWGAD